MGDAEDLVDKALALAAEGPTGVVELGLKVREAVVRRVEASSSRLAEILLNLLD